MFRRTLPVAERDPRDVFLEVAPASLPAPPAEARAQGPAYLEPAAPDDLAPADESAEGTSARRRKVRAADRAPSAADAASLAIVTALQTDRPLMLALWPDVPAVELLRAPPPDEAFAARCDFARRALDAVGRRDAESRARAEVAQRALQRHLDALASTGASPRDAALAALRRAQVADLYEAMRDLAGPSKSLYAADVQKLVAAAEARGIDGAAARNLARERGYELHEETVRTWTALDQLPGAPSTMDAVALALLQHPAQGAEAVRSGAVLAWLRANNASADHQQRARDARMLAERGASGSLAVHSQAWAFGRKDLALGPATLRAPGDIAPAVRNGTLSLDDLARSARDGTLAAWLRMQGWIPAAGAADLVARGEPMGLKRLAWSLGEALVVGDQGVGDPASLARVVVARPELRDALTALYTSGDLLAWLESLPPVLRDEHWTERLRRAHSDTARGLDTLPLWMGVWQHARSGALPVNDRTGGVTSITSVSQLRVTAQVAELWDGLKRAHRTGELLAWLSVMAPEIELARMPRPPRDDDGELNALLWSLGHQGLVLEWGASDLPVTSLADLVRAYQRAWQQLEAQVARGYVFDWIERFHGASTVLAPAEGAAVVRVRDVVAWLRVESGRLPAGHLALKLALLCGLRVIPVDACSPGDAATVRGYAGVSGRPPGTRAAWEPLRDLAASGAAVLWLALGESVRPQLARSMLQSAFLMAGGGMPAQEYVTQVIVALGRTFGDPVPTPALARELAPAEATATASLGLRETRPPTAPAKPTSVVGLVLRAAFVAALAVVGWNVWTTLHPEEPPQPVAPPASEVWVQLRVRIEADRTQSGRPWDHDQSAPELRATLHPRDERFEVGPCDNARVCEGTVNAARLVPGVVFRVSLDELDWAIPRRVGAAWFVWRGGREETLRARLGAAEVTVTVKRLTFQPAPVAPERPVVTPDAGTRPRTAIDAGTRPRTNRRSTARPRNADPALPPSPGPMAPVGDPFQ